MIRFEVLTTGAAIDAIASRWDELAAISGRPMSTSHWYRHALQGVHRPSERLHVITAWRDAELVGVVPLILSGEQGSVRYELIGTRTLYEPTELLARPEATVELARYLLGLSAPVRLTRLLPGDFTAAFARGSRRRGLLVRPRASGSQYVSLDGGWQAYYEARSGKLRNMLGRARKQLAKAGPVTTSFVRPGPEEAGGLLQQAFAVEQRSWKGRAGSAVLQRPDLHAFFTHYGLAAAAKGELLVSLLRLSGNAIAAQIASIHGGSYWQLKIGYDEQYAKQLVGLQLQMETLRWSFEQRLTRYEFLGSSEQWIREWTSDEHSYQTLMFYPWSWRGLRGLVVDNASRLRGRFARKSPTCR